MQFKKPRPRSLRSLFLPLLIIFVCSVAVQAQVVHFADPNLEMAVRAALKNHEGSITADDMTRLIELNAAARGITDLSGLEYAVNLQSLDLGENQISDISPLADLTALRVLHLEINLIQDISPLATLGHLRELDLSGNRIWYIYPLANLTDLVSLNLTHNWPHDSASWSSERSLIDK